MHISFRIPFTCTLVGTGRPCEWQQGFWIDRIRSGYTAVGLGRVLLHIEQAPAAL